MPLSPLRRWSWVVTVSGCAGRAQGRRSRMIRI
jgi:hypothetical protein